MNATVNLRDRASEENALSRCAWQLLVLSARSPDALRDASRKLAAHLQKNPGLDLADVAFTLTVGREVFEHGRYVLCQTPTEAIETLGNFDSIPAMGATKAPKTPKLAFWFRGEPLQVNAARALYESEPVFRDEVHRLASLGGARLEEDLAELVYPADRDLEGIDSGLRAAGLGEAARLIVECALVQLWASWGVHPRAVIGCAGAEYTSMCVAGALAFEDAVDLVVARARFDRHQLSQPEFIKLTQKLELSTPRLPTLSSVSGTWMDQTEVTDPSYWVRQLQWSCDPQAGIQTLRDDGVTAIVGIGPGSGVPPGPPATDGETHSWLSLQALPEARAHDDERRAVLSALGALHLAGVPIDWPAFYRADRPRRVPLPSYPFERRRLWFDAETVPQAPQPQTAPPAFAHAPLAQPGRSQTGEAVTTPGDDIERVLLSLCEEHLGVSGIGLHDNVIALGIDSLFTMQLSQQVAERYGVTISPHHLFAEPHIASLARAIRHAQVGHAESDAGPPQLPDETASEYDRLLRFVEGLSDDEVDRLLQGVTDA